MVLYENFPYTNFHDMNMDWIITEVKKIRTEWDDYSADMDLWKQGVDQQLETFQTWFDNLDVQDEVRVVVQEMVADGTFLTVTTPTITAATESWLSAHVDPATGYVLDDTLTIHGAAADAKAAGDRITDLKEDIRVSNDLTSTRELASLPAVLRGVVDFQKVAESDCLIYGTHNVVDLLGIVNGSFTLNGMTITIDGTEMTFSGTATSSFRFDLLTGTENGPQVIAGHDCNLPIKSYTIMTPSIYQNATYYPSLSIRKKDNTGDVVTTQNSSVQFNGNPATCGGAYVYFTSGRAYDCKWNFAIFPYATTLGDTYKFEGSNVTRVDQSKIFNADGYTWVSGSPITYYLVSKLPKKPLMIYSTREVPYTGAVEVVDIYIPAIYGYVDYIYAHTVGSSQIAGDGNVWRLVQVVKVDESFERTKYLTTLGETEMALKIQGRSDFIGGWSHGDEWLIDDTFMCIVDGDTVDVTSITSMREFEKLQFFTRTNLYDPNNHSNKVGEHSVEWVFTQDGLTLTQVVDFMADLTMVGSYIPMLCAIRDNVSGQTLQITDTYIDDGNLTQYDISEAGFTSYPYDTKPGINTLYLIGKEEDVEMTVDFIRQPETLTNHGVYIFNGAQYNKMYNAICCGKDAGTQNVASGDRWRMSTHINIKA